MCFHHEIEFDLDEIMFRASTILNLFDDKIEIIPDILIARNMVSDADKLEDLGKKGYNRCRKYILEKSNNLSDEPEITESNLSAKILEHCKDKLFNLEPYFRTKGGLKLCQNMTQELKNCFDPV